MEAKEAEIFRSVGTAGSSPSRKEILFVTSFPPPFTGETIATQFFFNYIARLRQVERVDLSHGAVNPRRTGTLALSRIVQIFRSYARTWRLLRKSQFDIIYFVPGTTLLGQCKDWLLFALVSRRKETLVCHIHQGDFAKIFSRRFAGKVSGRLYERVDRFIHLSKTCGRPVVERFPDARHAFVNNPTTAEVEMTAEVSEVRKRRKDSPWQLLYLSNMMREKGFLDVVQAVKLLRDEGHREFRLCLAGAWLSEHEETTFRSYLAAEDFGDQVVHLGAVRDRLEVRRLLLEADVFLLPTYYSREAQPICLIEAANAALPIISTRHGGIPDIVIDGYNGVLVPPRDPSALAEALRRVCSPDVWLGMALNSREHYETEFSNEKSRTRFQEAIASVG